MIYKIIAEVLDINEETLREAINPDLEVNVEDIKKMLEVAFNVGRTLENYKGERVDHELYLNDFTSSKYESFDAWINSN